MKKLLFLAALCCLALTAAAVPAKRGQWRTLRLADGTTVRAELRGDEFCRFFQAADGTAYRLNRTTSQYETVSLNALAERAQARRQQAGAAQQAAAARRVKMNASITGQRMSITGKRKGLIILVEFQDQKFAPNDTVGLYRRIANEENFREGKFKGSLYDYFNAQSRGQFELDFDIAGPVQLQHATAYYGGNDSNDSDTNAGAMVEEACLGADAEVNFADYDWDGDGEVEQVFVLYAGLGEANGGAPETVWPHEYSLRYAAGHSLNLDGVKVDTYACGSELQPTSYNTDGTARTTAIDGIGTICHEFSHCLGYPDMYDTNYEGFGMGSWDIMDNGSYNGGGFQPAGYTGYERWLAGWMDPIELDADEVEVSGMKALSDGGEVYRISSKNKRYDEYYILENRRKTGWDASLYGEGLLVVHVDYSATAWAWNQVNTTASHQRMTPIPADNTLSSATSSYKGDPFPYNRNDSLTNNSLPAAKLYNNNADGTKYMNACVYKIRRNATDGTISFKYKPGKGIIDDPSAVVVTDTLFYEGFTLSAGTGGNVNPDKPEITGAALFKGTVANAAFVADNEGWSSPNAHGGYQCAKFGSAAVKGSATSPLFRTAGEGTTVSFTLAPFGADNPTVDVELLNAEGNRVRVLDTYSPTAGQWTTFTTPIDDAADYYALRFAAAKRLFIDEVRVMKPGSEETGILLAPAAEARPRDLRVFTLDGRCVGTGLRALPRGIYVQDGRKVVK